MRDLQEEFLKLKAQMEKDEQDRLWGHFLKTGQVLPTISDTMKEIDLTQRKIYEVEKFMWTNPFPQN